jgi:hypothetical protein
MASRDRTIKSTVTEPVRRLHLGDTGLAGAQLRRQRGLPHSALLP